MTGMNRFWIGWGGAWTVFATVAVVSLMVPAPAIGQITGQTVTQAGEPIEGVLVVGEWGRKMVVRQNYVSGFSTGIRVHGLNDTVTGTPQWVVSDNTITDLLSGGTRVSTRPSQVASRGNNYD